MLNFRGKLCVVEVSLNRPFETGNAFGVCGDVMIPANKSGKHVVWETNLVSVIDTAAYKLCLTEWSEIVLGGLLFELILKRFIALLM